MGGSVTVRVERRYVTNVLQTRGLSVWREHPPSLHALIIGRHRAS